MGERTGGDMKYIPHTDDERREMLDAIGVPTMEDLFADVPEQVRFPKLDLPPPSTELEIEAEMQRLADFLKGPRPVRVQHL